MDELHKQFLNDREFGVNLNLILMAATGDEQPLAMNEAVQTVAKFAAVIALCYPSQEGEFVHALWPMLRGLLGEKMACHC